MCTPEIAFSHLVLQDGTRLRIPYWDLRSHRPGPVLLVMAAQHGNEISGSAAIEQFVAEIAPELRAGRILALPFANPLALRARRPHFDLGPEQPYIDSHQNMAMYWPGDATGRDSQRLTAALWHDLVLPATHIIDLHCYPRSAAPLIMIADQAETIALAECLGFPFIRLLALNEGWTGALRWQAGRLGKVVVGCELSGQYRVYPGEVQRGKQALLNAAGFLGLSPEPPLAAPAAKYLQMEKYLEVRAPHQGLFIQTAGAPGSLLQAGQEIGCLLSEQTLQCSSISAPVDAYLLRSCARPDCDVALPDQHQFVFAQDVLAVLAPA
ncbi:MAG: succinylglutamate desuccinylase/aspartoacylase family protein [Oligosphaeraceae bacterium]|jgi:predicted deacylase|nr:succinylglutamate desuccinylase/aspartoacylase family protein [Oligosphaeraceae bacterium]